MGRKGLLYSASLSLVNLKRGKGDGMEYLNSSPQLMHQKRRQRDIDVVGCLLEVDIFHVEDEVLAAAVSLVAPNLPCKPPPCSLNAVN